MPPIVPIAAVPFTLAVVSWILGRRTSAGARPTDAILWGVSLTLGLFAGLVLAFFEPVRALDQEAVCGAGATLLHTIDPTDDGGPNHDFSCSNGGGGALIAVHVVGCMIFMTGVFALAAIAMRRTIRAIFIQR